MKSSDLAQERWGEVSITRWRGPDMEIPLSIGLLNAGHGSLHPQPLRRPRESLRPTGRSRFLDKSSLQLVLRLRRPMRTTLTPSCYALNSLGFVRRSPRRASRLLTARASSVARNERSNRVEAINFPLRIQEQPFGQSGARCARFLRKISYAVRHLDCGGS